MSGALVTVTGRYVLADDTPAQGSVLLTPVVVAGMSADTKRLVTRHSVAGRLDADGEVSLNVLASDDPDWMVDGPVLYEVAEYIAGARGKAYQVVVPGPGPVDLADLQPVDDPQTVAAYPVPGPKGDPGPAGLGLRVLSAVPTVGDLPTTGNQPGDAHLVTATGNLHVWDGSGWTEIGHIQGPPGPAGGISQAYVDAGDAANSAETRAVADELALVEDALQEVKVWAGDPTPLHINSTLSEWLTDLADEVHHLSSRPAFVLDGILHVDLYNGFARVFSNTPELEVGGEKWVEFELAATPAPGGTVPPGTNAVASSAGALVRAGGTQGPVIGNTGGAVSQMALANYISQNRICRVLYDKSNPTRPTLTILETLDAIPTGSSGLHIGALYDVSAPANTPAGKVLGTVAEGSWGPVDPKSLVSPLAPVTPYMQGVVPATNLTQTANLGKWIAARKTATESLVRIACLGNSNTFATSGASGEADGSMWAWPFRVAAATGLPVAGRVDVCNGHSVLSAHVNFPSGNPYKRPYINATGSWEWRTYSGIGMAGYMQCLQGGTGQLTYTSVEECEQFIVGYRDNNVVFTYQVDNGPLVTVTCANSDNTLELLIPAGAKGIHTLKINAPVSGTEGVGIPYIGASLLKGVVVANFGVPGSTSADWYGDTTLPNGSMGNSVKPFQPHLVIHQAPSGADEGKATPITPAQAQGFVTNVITYVRANCPNADYIYMQRWDYGDDATSTQYGDAIISNCTTNNVPLFRQDQVVGADASKWLTPTNNHLIRTAHMRIGDSVGTAIMSDWLWQPQLGGSTGGGLTPEQVLAGTNVTVDRATTPGSVIISSTGGGAAALTGLTDVTVTSPQTLAPFVYGGSSVWRNYAPGDQLNVSHIKAPSAYSLRLMSQDGAVRVRVANTGVTFFTDTVIDGGGTGVIGIANASVVPTTAPTNASILYSEGGVLKVRNAGQTAAPVATSLSLDAARSSMEARIAELEARIAALEGP